MQFLNTSFTFSLKIDCKGNKIRLESNSVFLFFNIYLFPASLFHFVAYHKTPMVFALSFFISIFAGLYALRSKS